MKALFIFVLFSFFLFADIADASPTHWMLSYKDDMDPLSSHEYSFSLNYKEPTTILVHGSGSSDLDCYLLDSQHHIIAADMSSKDECKIDITPFKKRGAFFLNIKNIDDNYNRYEIFIF